jgi:hypothetical protein
MASARCEIKGTCFARINTPSFPSRQLKFWELFMEFMQMAHSAPTHGGSGPPKLILSNLLSTSPSLASHNGSKHSWPQWVHGTFGCSYLIDTRTSFLEIAKPHQAFGTCNVYLTRCLTVVSSILKQFPSKRVPLLFPITIYNRSKYFRSLYNQSLAEIL